MYGRRNTLDRLNTYLPREFFKAIVLAATKEKSESAAQWITETSTSNRGVYGCPYNRSQMIIFPRYMSKSKQPKVITTVAVEAFLIFADSVEEFNIMKSEVLKYGNVPIVVVVSNANLSKEAESIKAVYFPKEVDSQSLKIKLDFLDKKELKKIKDIFGNFDIDGNGTIDSDEMTEIALSLGEDLNSENFKLSIMALDTSQEGIIRFTEFCAWWKIGRQNILTLPKIFSLNQTTKTLVQSTIDFKSYYKEIRELESTKDYNSKQKIYIRSPGIFKIRSFIECSLAIGGQMRIGNAMEFLSSFTKNSTVSKNNFISVILPLDEKRNFDQTKARRLLEEFKDNILKWGRMNKNPVFVNFVENFTVFEFNSNDKSVIMVVRLKLDIEELVKVAIDEIIFIMKNLSEVEDSFWFNLKSQSNLDLHEALLKNNNMTLGDWLKVSEFYFEGSSFKNRFKAFYNNLTATNRKRLTFLTTIFFSDLFELEFEGDPTELDYFDELFKICLKYFAEAWGFLKNNISADLLAACKSIQFGINMFDVFASIKFYSQSVFARKY